ncbi:MAG: hypothetical protein EAZ89_01775, partial [Bacteroidetes bacterium]
MSTQTQVDQPKVIVPEWVHEIKRKYLSQNVSQFIVHGSINDYVPVQRDGQQKYYRLRDFLNEEMFKYKDTVIYLDKAVGIKFKDDKIFGGDGGMRQEFLETMKLFDELTDNNFGELSRNPLRSFFTLDTYFNLLVNQDFLDSWVRAVEKAMAGTSAAKPEARKQDEDIIERFMRLSLPELGDNKDKNGIARLKERLDQFKKRLSKPKSIALIIEYAETLIPMTENASSRPDDQMLLIFMQKWAKEQKFLDADLTIIVLTENIIDINAQYVRNPFTFDVSISYPDEANRLAFIHHFLGLHAGSEAYFEMKPEIMAKNTAGLGLVQLETIMAEAVRNKLPFTNAELTRKKKEMIEAEAGGLLEFVEGKYSLADVAGHAHAKKNLLDAARALKAGRPDVMPMGYLVSGPVG